MGREPFECTLCARGGQPTLAPQQGRLTICEDHYATLCATGRGWCHRGNHVVSASAMLANKRNLCRPCDNARRKERYDANAEEERAKMRAYYQGHKAERRASADAWRRANPERVNAHKRAYRNRNKERAAAWAKAYRERHPERVRETALQTRMRAKLRVLRQIRRAA